MCINCNDKNHKRPTRQEYYADLAMSAAKRSSCPRASVGALIVKDGVIISTGYNGAAKGECDCYEKGCLIENGHCVRTIHAEENAIINCAKVGVSIEGSEMYVTHRPCNLCSRKIINAGIKKVYYLADYGDKSKRNIELEDYISVEKLEIKTIKKED